VNSRHSVAEKTGIAVALVGAVAGLWFTALFVGGDPRVFAFEWLGLMALEAGLGAAVSCGYGRRHITRSTTIAALGALAVWTGIAVAVR